MFLPIAFLQPPLPTGKTAPAAPVYYQWMFTAGFLTKIASCNSIPGARTYWSKATPLAAGVVLYTDSAATSPLAGASLYYQEEITTFSGQVNNSGVIMSWAGC